VEAPEEESGEF